MHDSFKLMSLSSGAFFGDIEVIEERKTRYATATCVSSTGSYFRMEAADFVKWIYSNEDSKIEVQK